MITAAADGSSLANPGPSGWAWYVNEDCWAAGGWEHGTNNKGELYAVLDLLNATHGTDEDLLIICDSQYVINAITKWMPGWKRKGWKKADGKPVQNQDLMVALDKALAGRSVSFEWTKGHAGHDMNEAADARARAAATAYRDGTPVDSGPGFTGMRSDDTETSPEAVDKADEIQANADAVEAREATLRDTDLADEAPADAPSEDRPAEPAGPHAEPHVAEGTTEDAGDDLREVVALESEVISDRPSAERLRQILHPDYVEFASTGRIWTLAHRLADPPNPPVRIQGSLIASTSLAPGVAHLTWKISAPSQAWLRSSVWVWFDGSWRLRFTQASPVNTPRR